MAAGMVVVPFESEEVKDGCWNGGSPIRVRRG